MAGYDLGIGEVEACETGAVAGDIEMRSSVGAVTADAVFLIIFVGQRIHVGRRLHGLMERGVESDNLGHVGEHMRDGMYAQKVGGVVQRGEIAADFDLAEHVVVDEGAAGEEVGALHDAVAHGLDVIKAAEHSVGGIHEKVEDEPHSDLVVRYRKFLGIGFLAGGLMGHLSFGKTDFLDDAFCQKIVDIVAFHIKELVLDG